jgi:nitrate/nitrite-specific signal transduction histidine kinase
MNHGMKHSALTRRTFCGSALALGLAGASQAQVKNIGEAINKAGRQRMLSQRMAQFHLASVWGVDSAGSQQEIIKARDEFIPALELLRNAPEATQEVKQTLLLADGQWMFFDNALKAQASNPKAASQVFVASENLLQVMDSVTSQYARILG